jgi:hypothetical protein
MEASERQKRGFLIGPTSVHNCRWQGFVKVVDVCKPAGTGRNRVRTDYADRVTEHVMDFQPLHGNPYTL